MTRQRFKEKAEPLKPWAIGVGAIIAVPLALAAIVPVALVGLKIWNTLPIDQLLQATIVVATPGLLIAMM